ncbi:MAG TPA: hypothetical protein VGV39_10915 [Mesorhizobium sp.]|uniref:hypothetical protein n=1 Tax=Mesorhizobium sp. TaxID=1871066 RepID=UPI002DDD504E|nr:hypothetical protein [Mesorhizobium sp.]HEV2503580.1 hypothetical protein [Mesorhizobium sp.]
MWTLTIRMDGATKEELRSASKAAEAVFIREKIHPLDGLAGHSLLEDWDERGCHDDDPDYTDEDARNANTWIGAEEAAILALSKGRSFFEVSRIFEMTVVEINAPANVLPVAANNEIDLLTRKAA